MRKLFTIIIVFIATTMSLQAQQHDLSISYTNYSPGQYIGYGNIQTKFNVINHGPSNLLAGDTILLAVSFNNIIYDMYLQKQDSVTFYKLTSNLKVGDTLTLNPGYLIGYQWEQYFAREDSLNLCLIVYGVGISSWNNSFSGDSNPSNNTSCITYKNIDLGIKFTNYSAKEVTNNKNILTQFEVTNYGPVKVLAGDTIFLGARINGHLYDLSLTAPNGSTSYTLSSDLNIGQTFTVTPGNLNGATTAAYLGTDTAQISVLVHGVGKISVDTLNGSLTPHSIWVYGAGQITVDTSFATDNVPSNNIATVTYNDKIDLGIRYNNYTNGQVINSGNVQTAFTVTNYGPSALSIGDTIYVGAKINGTYYKLDLSGPGANPIVLTQNVAMNGTFTYNPGYLNGAQTTAYLGVPSVDICVVVYGKGLASVGSSFPKDPVSSNNTSCVTYDERGDLGIQYNNYTNGQVLNSGDVQRAFTVTNYDSIPLSTGDTIYVGAKINGTYYKLDLSGSGANPIILTQNVPMNGTFTYNPGNLDGAGTLTNLGVTSADICVVVYGKGLASVGSSFPKDKVSSNNTSCVTYNKTATGISSLSGSNALTDVKVYPNPAVNEVNFEFSKTGLEKITITDLTGKVIKVITIINAKETVNISDLENGVYLYIISSKDAIVKTDRLVIIK